MEYFMDAVAFPLNENGISSSQRLQFDFKNEPEQHVQTENHSPIGEWLRTRTTNTSSHMKICVRVDLAPPVVCQLRPVASGGNLRALPPYLAQSGLTLEIDETFFRRMEPYCNGMKSVMDFFLKTELNGETGKYASTDLSNESPQQPVHQKFQSQLYWKCAYDKSKGFARYEMCTAHVYAMSNWEEEKLCVKKIKKFQVWTDVIKAAQKMINNLRNHNGFLQLLSKVGTSDKFLCNKRHRKLSRELNEFLLYGYEIIGRMENIELKTSLKQFHYENAPTIFDLKTLKYLCDLSEGNALTAEAEITTAMNFYKINLVQKKHIWMKSLPSFKGIRRHYQIHIDWRLLLRVAIPISTVNDTRTYETSCENFLCVQDSGMHFQ
ncbi:hypothetical protein T10_11362 [Trichinella papuae]|uniref:Uncharacterized protein n=1 Tax=Trichinella papuae TaxID=268474 RepID=A0A0V1N1T1_9BILA|nr:hypothetical protein T10_11362 [Trichinella papuae]